MPTTKQGLEVQQFERELTRGLKFLRAVSEDAEIKAALEEMGYTETDHQEGWHLLWRLHGWRPAEEAEATAPSPNREAVMTELKSWYDRQIAWARVLLEQACPEQAAYIFDEVVPDRLPEGFMSELVVILSRVDNLRARVATDEEGSGLEARRALAVLEERGIIGGEQEAHIRALLEQAQNPAPLSPGEPREEREGRFKRYQAWIRIWREAARLRIKKRSQLLRMGLQQRRKSRK